MHEYWAWARGSTLKGDLRYTNTTIFETFPFPPLTASSSPLAAAALPPSGKAGPASDGGLQPPPMGSPGGAGGPAHHSPVAPASAPEGGRTPPRSAAPPDADTAVRATGMAYDPRVIPDTPEARRVAAIAEELHTKRQAACRALGLGLTKLYNYIKGKTPLPDSPVGAALVPPCAPVSAKGEASLAPTKAQAKGEASLAPTGKEEDGGKLPPPPLAGDSSVAATGELAGRIAELRALHEQLNAAVCACYGWPEDTWRDENEVLRRLLALNQRLAG